jgi:RNA polymerase sigma factor (sigma-70 family)
MAGPSPTLLLRHLRRLMGSRDPEAESDADLLGRYVAAKDEAAFAALVHRHAALVWNVCRRNVAQEQDAEDAFQATFLVLAHKARSVRWQVSIAVWLHEVARRLASKARYQRARGPQPLTSEPAVPDALSGMSAAELLSALDAEVAALPERYREPLVHFWLDGKTQKETARLVGASLSTVRRRLERARELLRLRLTRRGLAPAAVLGVLALAPTPAQALPRSTLAGAWDWAAASIEARALAGTLPLAGAAKGKALVALLLAVVLVAGIGWALAPQSSEPSAAAGHTEAPVAAPGQGQPRVDALGDPLPLDALLRLGTIRFRHGSSLSVVAWSPVSDTFACAGWDKQIRFWDGSTGKELHTIPAPENGVNAIAFTPDGKWLAAATTSEEPVILWDAATGKEVRRFKAKLKDDLANRLAISRDGAILVAGIRDRVYVWDMRTGKVLHQFEVTPSVIALNVSPDGKAVAAATGGQLVRMWNAESGEEIRRLTGLGGPAMAVFFSPDSKKLITAGVEQTCVWDVESGKKLATLSQGVGEGEAEPTALHFGGAAALSADGRLLALGCQDQRIRVWEWEKGKKVLELRPLPDHVRSVAFSRDGKTLAALGDATAIHLWDTATGQLRSALAGHHERLTSVAYMPDGKTIATAAWDGTMRLWDAQTGKEKRVLEPERAQPKGKGDPAGLGHIVVSPDGKRVAVMAGFAAALVFDPDTGKQVQRYTAESIAFSPDGKWIACGESGKEFIIRVFDRATGKTHKELKGHLTQVVWLAFTPDSQRIVSRGQVWEGLRSGEPGEDEKNHIRVWDVASGKERKSLLSDYAYASALAADGRTLAYSKHTGSQVGLVEILTGALRATLNASTEMVFDVAFAPDGRTVATANMDGTIRLFDPFTGKELGKLEGHRGWVLSVAFSPDGKTLVSGGLDTTGLVWDVSRFTQRPGAELTAKDAQTCWTDLGKDADTAYAAIGRLRFAPEQVLALFQKQLQPAPGAKAERIAKLVKDLDSNEFKVRDQATRELEKLGEVARPAIEKALTDYVPLEMRKRLELLLEKMDDANLPPETLRQVRAVEVLQALGTSEARRLLERLAKDGASDARLTGEARAALAMWGK